MRISVAQLAQLVGGTLRGNGDVVIEDAAGLAEAGPTDVSFLSNPKYKAHVKTTRAGVLLVSSDEGLEEKTVILVKNPLEAWGKILTILNQERQKHPVGIHPTAVIAPTAVLGAHVALGAFTVVDDGAVIGDRTVLYPHVYVGAHSRLGTDVLVYPHVTFRERVTVGDRCVFQPGVVIGGDGYGFVLAQGRHMKIPQVGTVVIEDDVEIQANTTIDRGAVGVTRIGRGTKVDNLVQIAHGVDIGTDTLVVAQTGIAGSARIGNNVTLAAQVGVAGHLKIGDNVVAAARTGVSQDVAPNQVIWGAPSQPMRDEMKTLACLRRLPKLMDDFQELRKKLTS